jgi:hypothetical protein
MHQDMKLRVVSVVLLMVSAIIIRATPTQHSFDKSRYYEVISSENINAVNEELKVIEGSSNPDKDAFEGALLMKKASFVKGPDKLHLFKSGRSKLENSIKKNMDNTELRFLRVIIQEHAPKIVNYRGDLQNDAQIIQHSFRSLSPVVQKAIADYSKQSKIISEKEL